MCLLNKIIVLLFLVGSFSYIYAIPDPDKTGIVFINGIWTENNAAKKSAMKTNDLLGLPKGTVEYIHNPNNYVADLWDVFKELRREGAIKDGKPNIFWEWMIRPKTAPDVWNKKHVEVIFTPPSPVDISALKIKLDQLRKRKTDGVVIVSHSQGNQVANSLIREVTKDSEFDGEQCMAMVSVATPSLKVSNNGPYITFENDKVINGARAFLPYGSLILPGNYPPTSAGDFSKHGYRETYLKDWGSSNDIANHISNQVSKVKANCKSITCGIPLTKDGYFSEEPQIFTFYVPKNSKNEPQDIEINFEAYYIPDSFTATANGKLLFSTDGLISGSLAKTVKFDPKVHGNKIDIEVLAPNISTAWRMCITCPDSEPYRQCKNLNMSKFNLTATALHHIENVHTCEATSIKIDGIDITNKTVGFTEGRHAVTWEGGCKCDSLGVGGCYPFSVPNPRLDIFRDDIPYSIYLYDKQPKLIDLY